MKLHCQIIVFDVLLGPIYGIAKKKEKKDLPTLTICFVFHFSLTR